MQSGTIGLQRHAERASGRLRSVGAERWLTLLADCNLVRTCSVMYGTGTATDLLRQTVCVSERKASN